MKSFTLTKISALLGILIAIGAFLNLPLRPAWAWELNELNQQQLKYQIEFYRSDMNRIDKELYSNRKLEREYKRSNEQPEEWVYKERSRIEREQSILQQKLKSAQDRLIQESK